MRRATAAQTAAVVVAATTALLTYLLIDSLPRRSGTAPLPTLSGRVAIELDRYAIPRIRGASLLDVYRAQGFMHAQERFFQMDLARRSAAGELAALVGRRALPLDRRNRTWQFRRRAAARLATLAPRARSFLDAYSAGVNAGIADLGTRPPEYLLLRGAPEPWTPIDSLLVAYSLYTELSNSEDFERGQDAMREVLPPELYTFLTPSSSRFDRPITALGSADETGGYVPSRLPSAAIVDLRGRAPKAHDLVRRPFAGAASNHWALPGTRTRSGNAILANDPHLGLRVPSTFYRAELYWDGHAARGVGIPGLPGILIGATERIAWGATVSYADQADLVVIEIDPQDPNRYATPDGFEAFTRDIESISIAGTQAAETIEVVATRWGPLIGTTWRGHPLALRATWLDPDGLDLGLLDLPLADSAQTALAVLADWAGPSLNWLVADVQGDVAWTVNGPLPARHGYDGAAPESWADGRRGWQGRSQPPRIGPSRDRALFTANNRSLALDASRAISRSYRPPFRAQRVAELLANTDRLDEHDSLAMQLDTTAAAYDFLRGLALEAVADDDPSSTLRTARNRIASWNGRADVDDRAFGLLDRYYDALLEAVLGPLLEPVSDADPSFVYRWPLADEPLRRILETRPPHLLPEPFGDWSELLRAALEAAIEAGRSRPERWGDLNRLDIAHPLAAIPLLGSWLRFPALPLAGSSVSIRVATPSYGAVFRLSVAPAAPEDGILTLAGGQSGHFLSEHFDDQLGAWAAGEPTPFLAGPTVEQFGLVP